MGKGSEDSKEIFYQKGRKEVVINFADVVAAPKTRGRPSKAAEAYTPIYTSGTVILTAEDDGTHAEQTAFMLGLQNFQKERGLDCKPPKFYQRPLNILKLWRSVIKLGGYETVTAYELWRQVGEAFNPPKTCTTLTWTFRNIYERSLLEYEKYKIQSGELRFPALPETPSVAIGKQIPAVGNSDQGSEPRRVKRDAAARAKQGWHSQRYGWVDEPVTKDKNENDTPKRKKKFISSLTQKRPNDLEISNKVVRIQMSEQRVASVINVGPPADWVKVNVQSTSDCFEIYALVPGFLREEVRIQSDPAGRLIISGEPEKIDNPWGITSFKKVVYLPARIDPKNISAVVSLHGGLFIRVPYEQHPKMQSNVIS